MDFLGPQLFASAAGPTVLALAQSWNLSNLCLHARQESSEQHRLLCASLREQYISLAHSRLLQLTRAPTKGCKVPLGPWVFKEHPGD